MESTVAVSLAPGVSAEQVYRSWYAEVQRIARSNAAMRLYAASLPEIEKVADKIEDAA